MTSRIFLLLSHHQQACKSYVNLNRTNSQASVQLLARSFQRRLILCLRVTGSGLIFTDSRKSLINAVCFSCVCSQSTVRANIPTLLTEPLSPLQTLNLFLPLSLSFSYSILYCHDCFVFCVCVLYNTDTTSKSITKVTGNYI